LSAGGEVRTVLPLSDVTRDCAVQLHFNGKVLKIQQGFEKGR
jgi:hypothetical protein